MQSVGWQDHHSNKSSREDDGRDSSSITVDEVHVSINKKRNKVDEASSGNINSSMGHYKQSPDRKVSDQRQVSPLRLSKQEAKGYLGDLYVEDKVREQYKKVILYNETDSEKMRRSQKTKSVKFDVSEELSEELGEKQLVEVDQQKMTENSMSSFDTNIENSEMENMTQNIQDDEGDSHPQSTECQSMDEYFKENLVYGQEGYAQYKLYKEIEKKVKIEEYKSIKERAWLEYQSQIDKIDEIVKTARAYYKNPTGKAAEDWKKLREEEGGSSNLQRSKLQSHTDVRFHLSTLHEHRPIFTYIIILAQLAATITICILGKITFAGLEPRLDLMTGVKTFLGTETKHKWTPPNIWIGPSERYLISVGAVFAPCMREDISIKIDMSFMSYSNKDSLGCCEMSARNTAGTTTEQECEDLTFEVGFWRGGTICSSRSSGSNSVAHILKPCCTDLKGTCILVTHEHCLFLGGNFHMTGKEHCSQVNCLSYVCKMGGLDADPEKPWLPKTPRQWWRLPLSLLYHHGIIHVIMVSAVQFVLFRKIEQALGWLRVILIYLMTGIGGLLAAAIFSPYTPQCGATATIFGVIGILLVELLHFWAMVERPWIEMIKILVIITIFLLSGTLPYINNFSILIGFIIGIFSAFCFLPFVSFRDNQKRCRAALLVTSILLLFIIYFILFYLFYKVQTFQECKVCSLINCIPYTDKMCDTKLWSG